MAPFFIALPDQPPAWTIRSSARFARGHSMATTVTAPSNHSPEFMLDEASLDVGLRALLQVTLDYLEKPKG